MRYIVVLNIVGVNVLHPLTLALSLQGRENQISSPLTGEVRFPIYRHTDSDKVGGEGVDTLTSIMWECIILLALDL